jgi:hypothetical protein
MNLFRCVMYTHWVCSFYSIHFRFLQAPAGDCGGGGWLTLLTVQLVLVFSTVLNTIHMRLTPYLSSFTATDFLHCSTAAKLPESASPKGLCQQIPNNPFHSLSMVYEFFTPFKNGLFPLFPFPETSNIFR